MNEATGDVYVVDKGNNRVEYFNSAASSDTSSMGLKSTEFLREPEKRPRRSSQSRKLSRSITIR